MFFFNLLGYGRYVCWEVGEPKSLHRGANFSARFEVRHKNPHKEISLIPSTVHFQTFRSC